MSQANLGNLEILGGYLAAKNIKVHDDGRMTGQENLENLEILGGHLAAKNLKNPDGGTSDTKHWNYRGWTPPGGQNFDGDSI